ncbi:hypothetical protein [Maritalea sp.]|uniref:hypothetical protein n=1 Tax=Maritalea sp. TaxID=2003361 RepID=UPI003EF0AD93
MKPKTFVSDTETIVKLVEKSVTNAQINALVKFSENNNIVVNTQVKNEVTGYTEKKWNGAFLDNVEVKAQRNKDAQMVKAMLENCKENGFDIMDKNFQHKVRLVALARHHGAVMLTTDLRQNDVSMKSLCSRFGVAVLDPSECELAT